MKEKILRLFSFLSIGLYIILLLAFLILATIQPVMNVKFTPIPVVSSVSVIEGNPSSQETAISSITEVVDDDIADVTQATEDVTPALTDEEPLDQTNNEFDEIALGEQMLKLINQERSQAGLLPVAWDGFDAGVAKEHAEDMAKNQFFSHWNLEGFGPDHRYAFAGGTDVVMENISNHCKFWEDGTPIQLDNFDELVVTAHEGLMNSPGHRRNILDPNHTHVGLGFAYNPDTGCFYVAQEFTNHYVELSDLPNYASPGESLEISGELLLGASDPLLNIAYESYPSRMSFDELAQTSSYGSAAQILEAYNPAQISANSFSFEIRLGEQKGIYHIRIWVDLDGQSVQAVNAMVIVE